MDFLSDICPVGFYSYLFPLPLSGEGTDCLGYFACGQKKVPPLSVWIALFSKNCCSYLFWRATVLNTRAQGTWICDSAACQKQSSLLFLPFNMSNTNRTQSCPPSRRETTTSSRRRLGLELSTSREEEVTRSPSPAEGHPSFPIHTFILRW